jgi:hypothetical protein
MTDAARLLAAYDAQLRGEVELATALRVERLGPLLLGVFPGGQGFITAAEPGGTGQGSVAALVPEALARLSSDAEVGEIEWKTRAHDDTPGLHGALTAAGFVAGEPEAVMIGEASLLAVDLSLPEGVALRTVSSPDEVRAASAMTGQVFGRADSEGRIEELLALIADGAELWIAEADGEIISSGRLEPVPGTEFAGIWGGATREDWRHRGVYRALTAHRARSAIRRGMRYLVSDSTEFSRPILERSGFVRVSTTTPYEWTR